MVGVSTFQKTNANLDEYSSNFMQGLQIAQDHDLIPQVYYEILSSKIESDMKNGSYIPRQDWSNFLININLLISKQEYILNFQNISQNLVQQAEKNQNEIAFEFISKIDDYISQIMEEEKKSAQYKLQNNYINQLKIQEQKEKEEQLDNLEDMLSQL